MSFDVIRSGGTTVIELGSEDPFVVTFRPAKPALDAVIEMLKPLRWLDQRRRSCRPLFEPEKADELINLIPDGNRIAKAGALFLEAERNSAPEGWAHIAIGLMLQAEVNAHDIDGDAYRCAVTDSAYRDPEIWGGHSPGFSAAVIVRAIRQARMGTLPSPGRFLAICIDQRRQFRNWHEDTTTLLDLRYQIEDRFEEIGKPLLLEFDPEDEVPF